MILGLYTPYRHFKINASTDGNGTITPNGDITVLGGKDQTFTFAPNYINLTK